MSALEQGEAESFNRIGDLVDLRDYDPYLIDSSDEAPLNPSGSGGDPNRFVKQHVFYPEPLYRQFDMDYEDRDPRIVAVRVLPYSQIVMRSYMEIKLHRKKESAVSRPSFEVADKIVRDYFNLDLVAAAALGIQEIAQGRELDYTKMRFQPHPAVVGLSKKDKRAALKEQFQKSLERLESPLVLPSIVVASSLKRLARHTQSEEMSRRAAESQGVGSTDYYPIVVPKLGHLRNVGYAILKDMVGLQPLTESRTYLQGLQKHPQVELIPA